MINKDEWWFDQNSPPGILRWRLPNDSIREWRIDDGVNLPHTINPNANAEDPATLPFQENNGDFPFFYASATNEYTIRTPEREPGIAIPRDAYRTTQENWLRPDAPE